MKHSPHLAALIEALRTLPGVGPKTAQRMAFHLLQEGRPGARVLAQALAAALDSVSRCRRCRMLTEGELCVICAAAQRDAALLCAVESPADVVAIESSGSYRGRYFVLMGHLSPLDGIGPEQLGVRELEAILAEGVVRELIIATNSTVELVAMISSRTTPSASIASSSRTPSCSGPMPSSGERCPINTK